MSSKKPIIVVGAGLSGTLLAIRMAQRGNTVKLFEKRPDLRKVDISAGRSINLALSHRGLMALDRAGMRQHVLEECIPMRGRMIHSVEGDLHFSAYSGREDEYINSVSRGGLNEALLDEADRIGAVETYFNQTCLNVDLEQAKATFRHEETGQVMEVEGEVIFGADGAGSAVRRSMMARTNELLFNYSQHFLQHGYKELTIPPSEDGGFRIERNALHIWPRGNFMVIALPNLDGSFTVTMFHPYGGEIGFDALDTRDKVKTFFETYFADLLPHMPNYLEEYFENPVSNLGTIRCYPWQAFGKALILGDAAHAIVPFYGQGMNASFEDVRVFDDLMDDFDGNWETLFTRFQDLRAKNANAIADLALDNFYEMRDHVADPVFTKKRTLERQLEDTYADYYSKYSLVTFKPEMPYAQAMELGRKQDELLMQLCAGGETPSLQDAYTQLMALQD